MKYKSNNKSVPKLQTAWTIMPTFKDAFNRAFARQNAIRDAEQKAKEQVASEKPKYTFVNPYDITRGWREATEDAAKQDKYTVQNLGDSEEEAQKAYNDFWKQSRRRLFTTSANVLSSAFGLSGLPALYNAFRIAPISTSFALGMGTLGTKELSDVGRKIDIGLGNDGIVGATIGGVAGTTIGGIGGSKLVSPKIRFAENINGVVDDLTSRGLISDTPRANWKTLSKIYSRLSSQSPTSDNIIRLSELPERHVMLNAAKGPAGLLPAVESVKLLPARSPIPLLPIANNTGYYTSPDLIAKARIAKIAEIRKRLLAIPLKPSYPTGKPMSSNLTNSSAMNRIREILMRSHRVLDAAGNISVGNIKFIDENGYAINPLGVGAESFVYDNPNNKNTVLKLTHSIFNPGGGFYRMAFKSPEEAMQFAQRRATFADANPAQLAIKPIGTVEYKGYHFPITMQQRVHINPDSAPRNSDFYNMINFVRGNIPAVGDAHEGNFGFIDLSNGNRVPIGIDLAPKSPSWQKYLKELIDNNLIVPDPLFFGDRKKIHLSRIVGRQPIFPKLPIQIKPMPFAPQHVKPVVPAQDVLPAQRFQGLRNFSAIGNNHAYLIGLQRRMYDKPEIMAKAMIKEGNVQNNPEIRQIGLDLLEALKNGDQNAIHRAWLQIVDYNKKNASSSLPF